MNENGNSYPIMKFERQAHGEHSKQKIQENNKKGDSKSYIRFANDNFLFFHVHNQKHKLEDDS